MKIYCFYQCDFGHAWTVFQEESTIEQSQYAICTFGHVAITLQKCFPVDQVKFILQPTGYIADKRKNQLVDDNKYKIIISDLDDAEIRASEKVYTWRDAIFLLEKFHTLAHTTKATWVLWEQLKPQQAVQQTASRQTRQY